MKRNEAIAYLTRCADANGVHWHGGRSYAAQDCPTCKGSNDAGWLRTPCSRYGWTSAHCAPVAYEHARIVAGSFDVDASALDESMSLVVNDSDTPQNDMRDYAIGLSGADIDAMVNGYLNCQLWAQQDNERDNEMLDANYNRWDISDEYTDAIRDEIAALVAEHPLAVRMYLNSYKQDPRLHHDLNSAFGHDYYLTREGHGAGFWDRWLGALGDYLTDIAKNAGSAEELWDNGNGELNR